MKKQKKGFAVMSVKKRRAIASMGGSASPTNFKRNKKWAKACAKKSAKKRIAMMKRRKK